MRRLSWIGWMLQRKWDNNFVISTTTPQFDKPATLYPTIYRTRQDARESKFDNERILKVKVIGLCPVKIIGRG